MFSGTLRDLVSSLFVVAVVYLGDSKITGVWWCLSYFFDVMDDERWPQKIVKCTKPVYVLSHRVFEVIHYAVISHWDKS